MRIRWNLPLLVAAMGCGGGLGSHEEATDAWIKAMDELMTVLEGIKDKDGVEAARPEVERIMERVEEAKAASAVLGEPGAEDRKRMGQRVAAAQKDHARRMGKIQERLQGDSETMLAVSKIMMKAVTGIGD